MTEWKKYKLGDLLDVKRGASLSGEYYATEGQYIRLTCGNFDYNQNCFKENTSKDNIFYIGQVRPEFIMKKGDIITPLTEQAIGLLGSTAIIPESDKYIQSQDVAKIICKDGKLYPAFAFYLVSSTMVKTQLSAGAQQTKIRHTSPDKIKDCFVWIPDYETQKRIASVLSNIDRKIALNRAMNEELEQTARDLYDYWFLQFDFPDANGKPYRSSGGKMVYNPQLKREIPQGWEVGNICKVADILSGGTPSKSQPQFWNGNILFFGPTDYKNQMFQLNTKDRITEVGLNKCASSLYEEGVIIITARGSIGKLVICGRPMAMNQSCYALRSLKGEYQYLYFLSQDLIKYLKVKGSGSTFDSIISSDIKASYFPIPYPNLITEFCKIVAPWFGHIKNNSVEIDHLTSLRDELLPLLMNGQVTIE